MTADLEIDVEVLQSLMQSNEDFLLIDCREEDEYAIARLEQAQLIPMGQIPGRLDELEGYRRKRIAVLCHHGGRSLQVAHWLRRQGFERAQSVSGGIDAWSERIEPSLPRY